MTRSQLIVKKGEPNSITPSAVDDDSEMFNYENESYQVKGSKVLMKFNRPEREQRSIQYWRHKFSNDNYTIYKVNKTEHTYDLMLENKTKKVSVLFDVKGNVLRIAKDGERLNE